VATPSTQAQQQEEDATCTPTPPETLAFTLVEANTPVHPTFRVRPATGAKVRVSIHS